MTNKDILNKAAKIAGVNIDVTLPSTRKVAVIGGLSTDEVKACRQNSAEALAVALEGKYPARVSKTEDMRSIRVQNSLLVFTPETLIGFLAELQSEELSKTRASSH